MSCGLPEDDGTVSIETTGGRVSGAAGRLDRQEGRRRLRATFAANYEPV